MSHYASEWYTSGVFWSAGAVVTAALAAAATVWATLRAAGRRRGSLTVHMSHAGRLLNATTSVRSSLQVVRNGTPLADPRLLRLTLSNIGRQDVPSSAYDNGRPIRLAVGAPIVEMINSESRPAGRALPQASVSGDAVLIGPGLIAAGQTLTFSLLVDGPSPSLSCHTALIDVDVEERSSAGPDVTQIVQVVKEMDLRTRVTALGPLAAAGALVVFGAMLFGAMCALLLVALIVQVTRAQGL
ncbi:hypothetical protein [Streptomyces sparsus]